MLYIDVDFAGAVDTEVAAVTNILDVDSVVRWGVVLGKYC